MFLEVAQCSQGLLCNTKGHLVPAPTEIACLELFLLWLLPWTCSSRDCWLRPDILEVTDSHSFPQRSLIWACSLSSGSHLPAPEKSLTWSLSCYGHSLVHAPVEFIASGLLQRSLLVWACFNRLPWPGPTPMKFLDFGPTPSKVPGLDPVPQRSLV